MEFWKQLVSAATEWLTEEISMIHGVRVELENMSIKMQTIQKVLDDAENKSMKDSTIKLWLEKLQDLSYDMEDVFDEWNTRFLMQKDERTQIYPSNEISSSSASNKFTCLSLTQFSCFTTVKQIGWRRDIALRIKNINNRMNSIFSEMEQLSLVSRMGGNNVFDETLYNINSDRITTSQVVESEVYGRDDVKNLILSKVLSEGSEELNRLQVISIVGVGGLGKTTLAQLVYNNEKVKAKFAKRIWVCVSDSFDEVKVARAILEGMGVDHSKMDLLQNLHESIKNSLSIQQFLLVLDDVWDEKFGKWNRLRVCLLDGGDGSTVGSTVLVTTRSEQVAKVVGTLPNNMIKPSLISDEDCWSRMSQIAFLGKNKAEYEDLEGIGKKISKKCKGLPLAASTLGGLLLSKSSEEEWTEVLESAIWELEEVELELFPHLFLSYRELPPTLKRCFSYLALFPKDSFVLDDQLISLWMAHGYLKSKRSRGQEYFKWLGSRALFEKRSIDWAGKCGASMHDILHDFALHLVGNEFLSIVQTGSDISFDLTPTSTKARHLFIRGLINPISIGDVVKLRSCLATRLPPNVIIDLVKQLKVVRALYLRYCNMEEVPEDIGKLIHLRTLDLSNNPFQELPETIGDLYNLQSLSLERAGSFSSYPKSIGRLINLQNVRGKVFRCGGSCNLGLLKNLNKLGGVLKINFTDAYTDEVDVKEAELKKKLNISKLVFAFNSHAVAGNVVEALQPPPNLQCLEIIEFGSSTFPSWITSLQCLTKLSVLNTKHVLSLPPLGRLESLKELLLSGLSVLKSISREFLGIDNTTSKEFCAFPKLKELEIYKCHELVEWEDLKPEDESKVTVMPKLHILKITWCPKLEVLPRRLLSKLSSLKELDIPSSEEIIDGGYGGLECLRINDFKATTVPKSILSFNYLTKLTITGSKSIIVCLPALGLLPSLEELDILHLSDLEFIGREFLGIGNNKNKNGFASFPKLVKLELIYLKKLKEWEDIKAEDEFTIVMPKLQSLTIMDCKQFHVLPRRLLRNAPSLEKLQLWENSDSLTESHRNSGETLLRIKDGSY